MADNNNQPANNPVSTENFIKIKKLTGAFVGFVILGLLISFIVWIASNFFSSKPSVNANVALQRSSADSTTTEYMTINPKTGVLSSEKRPQIIFPEKFKKIFEYKETGSEVWEVPEGVNKISVALVGAGGSGALVTGSGGGAGAYLKCSVNVSGIKSISVTVGKGGEENKDGEMTSIKFNNTLSGSSSIGVVGGAKGTMSSLSMGGYGGTRIIVNGVATSKPPLSDEIFSEFLFIYGGDGTGSTIESTNIKGGTGGSSFFGGGGDGAGADTARIGKAYGSGGGGGSNAKKGASGQHGVVIITYYK